MHVREGIKCVYSHIMGQGVGGKVVPKTQLGAKRKSNNHVRLAREIKAMANIGIHMDRLARHVTDASTLLFRPDQLEEYISVNSQDETSIEVVMAPRSNDPMGKGSSAVVPATTNTMLNSFHTQLPKSLTRSSRRRVLAKVVQTETTYMLQICINEDAGQFIVIIGKVINAPQIIERNTLECYYGAERKRRSISTYAERFKIKSVDSCNDGHPSNAKMERAVLRELNQKSETPWSGNRK